MSAIRTTAFAIWLISIVAAFDIGFTLTEQMERLPVSGDSIPSLVPILFGFISLAILVVVARAGWISDTRLTRLSILEKYVGKDRMKRFVIAVKPTKLLMICTVLIGTVGVFRTANLTQSVIAYIGSLFFSSIGVGHFLVYVLWHPPPKTNDEPQYSLSPSGTKPKEVRITVYISGLQSVGRRSP